MRSFARLALCLVAALSLLACEADRAVDPALTASDTDQLNLAQGAEDVARQIVSASGWEMAAGDAAIDDGAKTPPSPFPCLIDFERQHLADDIYFYSWILRIGTDPFDVIGLHRVVRERSPFRPIRARKSVFMLHGDFKTFAGCFLPGLSSDTYADDFGAAYHLAQGDVDVWGMDQAHNFIPADETDFSSMAEWDMFKYVHDTRTGLAIARVVRRMTGNGYRKMNLLGYSGGASLAFAVVSEEALLPRGLRHASGFIPVDQAPYAADAEFAASDCGIAQYYAGLVDSGEYVEPNFFPLLGLPARDDPDGASELIPGFTNLQAALAVAVYPYVEGFPYHFLAGEFDTDGLPTGLQYTDVDLWVDFLIDAPPYFPTCYTRDEFLQSCSEDLAPWLAGLGDVNLPVLYVSAYGGFGLVYEETINRMPAAEVTMLTVSLHPPEEIELDFGHVDLFTAENAPMLVWQPILDWILTQRGASAEEEAPRETSAR